MKHRFVPALLAAGLSLSAAAVPSPTYHLANRIAGRDGSYDYTAFDRAQGLLFIGRSFGVEALEVASGRYRTLLERKGVAAVLPIGERLMLSTNGDENSATLFDRTTGQAIADIPTGTEPDGASYDTRSGLAFVANGESRDLTVIDVTNARAAATIAVDGVPEASVSDGRGKLFVNLENRNAIAVIDIASRAVVGRYALPGCDEPTGIAYDARTDLLITACHNRVAKLISASTGADKGSIAIGQNADGSIFDPARRIGFIPCIDGSLTIFALDQAGHAKVLQRLKTSVGARTAAYDTVGDQLFLPTATVERDAAGNYVRAQRAFTVLRVARR